MRHRAKGSAAGAAPPTPPLRSADTPIVFEAALHPIGTCYAVTADGDAKLTLTVPASAARPLADAMAAGRLNDRTFLVRIELP